MIETHFDDEPKVLLTLYKGEMMKHLQKREAKSLSTCHK